MRQLIKARDDAAPVALTWVPVTDTGGSGFLLSPGSKSSWLSEGQLIGVEAIRGRLEPWLTSLFQSDHLSLLVGSGLTTAVHHIASQRIPRGMEKVQFQNYRQEIETEVAREARAIGRGEGNFEDQIRVVNALIRGLSILAAGNNGLLTPLAALSSELDSAIRGFADSVLAVERGVLASQRGDQEKAFNYLVSFLMSFASRTGTRDRLQIFTTNYDRLLEAGAELAGVHLIDRFVGSLSPILRASRLDIDIHYNPPGIRGEPRYLEGVARYSKLHGSVDWIDVDGTIRRVGLPLGAPSVADFLSLVTPSTLTGRHLMIYPNAAKDRETAAFPYVELFRDFAAAVCRPSSVLVTYGYGFGDEHINRVIEDMLTIPSTHLVIISYSDPLDRIAALYDRLGRHAQMTLIVGSQIADLRALVDHYLPKPAIDRTTFRMADLLKARWTTAQGDGYQTPEGHGK